MAVKHSCICNMRHVSAFTESHHQAFKNTQSKDITHVLKRLVVAVHVALYEGWNFNSGNYLFTNDTK